MTTLALTNQGFEYVYFVGWDSATATLVNDNSSANDVYLSGTGTTVDFSFDSPDSDPATLDGSGDTLYGPMTIAATSSDAVLFTNGLNYWIVSNVPQSFPLTTMTPYDGTNSQFVGPLTPCFVRGTLIATPEGERAVETLAIGDLVTTLNGTAPIKWLGRQTRNARFAKRAENLPVCITAGALGAGLPRRDLFVSPDHAMLVDGVLVHALALVNDASIVQMSDWPHENVDYFHIELHNHDIVRAEGALSETFVDNVTRKGFDNWREYEALYGEESSVPEMSLPRVKYRRQLAAATKKRLLAVALQRQRRSA